LAIDVEEPASTVEEFRREHGLTFTVLLSEDASVNPTFGIRALPTSWLVDRAGILRAIWVGPVPIEDAERQIKGLLASHDVVQKQRLSIHWTSDKCDFYPTSSSFAGAKHNM
jgi:hypothetical protein